MLFCTFRIYWLTPLDRDRMRAMPMMPMEPAKAVIRVRPRLVSRLFKDRDRAVPKPMAVFFWRDSPCFTGAASAGRLSDTTRPSLSWMMRVA